MKAFSAGLEIAIYLSLHYIQDLPTNELNCQLRFDDTMLLGDTKREFPLTLRYEKRERHDFC